MKKIINIIKENSLATISFLLVTLVSSFIFLDGPYILGQKVTAMKIENEIKDTKANIAEGVEIINQKSKKVLRYNDILTEETNRLVALQKNICINRKMKDIIEVNIGQHLENKEVEFPTEERINELREKASNECQEKRLDESIKYILVNDILMTQYEKAENGEEFNINETDHLYFNDTTRDTRGLKEVATHEKIRDGKTLVVKYAGDANKKLKDSKKFKKIFIVSGHNGKRENGWLDTGGCSNGMCETDITANFSKELKKELLTFLKPDQIEILGIGEDHRTLVEKIDYINQVAEKEGLNEKNSLIISTHANKSLSDTNRKGIEVFFSQEETTKKGLQGEDFASKILNSLREIHDHGNLYKVTSDIYTRYKQLGILSNTKPLSILIEAGFMTNVEDANWLKSNREEYGRVVAKGVREFLNIRD